MDDPYFRVQVTAARKENGKVLVSVEGVKDGKVTFSLICNGHKRTSKLKGVGAVFSPLPSF